MKYREKPPRQQWNIILDAVVTILKYKKITIDHSIYINIISNVTKFYFMVYNDDAINTTNNETAFPEPRIFPEEDIEIKVQEGSVLKCLNFRISSLLLVSILIRLITPWN